MPTYDYLCLDCGHKVEYFQYMSEPPVVECPRCKGRLQRMVSAGAGLVFKGSGFYITDYKKSSVSPTSTTRGETSSEKTSASDASKPTETKPVTTLKPAPTTSERETK